MIRRGLEKHKVEAIALVLRERNDPTDPDNPMEVIEPDAGVFAHPYLEVHKFIYGEELLTTSDHLKSHYSNLGSSISEEEQKSFWGDKRVARTGFLSVFGSHCMSKNSDELRNFIRKKLTDETLSPGP